MKLVIRDMREEDEYFVSTCSHVNKSAETDASGERRRAYFASMRGRGFGAKVALVDGEHAGFAFYMPIETCPWEMTGENLFAVPCVWVPKRFAGKGAGKLLVCAVEDEARVRGMKGVAIFALYVEDFWFMPGPYFERLGYVVAEKKGDVAVLWRKFAERAKPPRFTERKYKFGPVEGKVVIDLFYNTFCLTSEVEAQRVREVAAEFGDAVVLREHDTDLGAADTEHRLARGIYVNGEEIGWGYEAPREGIREAIDKALAKAPD